MKIKNYTSKILADLLTPLGIYLILRNRYSQVLLLESSDYASKKDSKSYICFDSLSSFVLQNGKLYIDKNKVEFENIILEINKYLTEIEVDNADEIDGVFGYTGFDAIPYLENLNFDYQKSNSEYPEMRYDFYRFVIVIDHYQNLLTIREHCPVEEQSQLDAIKQMLSLQDYSFHPFSIIGSESSNMTDDDFMGFVSQAKSHCQLGDIFQVVLSRKFQQQYSGDDINVYRALRSINPSPYLFYFDYGSFRIFGSSPEAQLKVESGIAEINPIAGTFKRTGDKVTDNKAADDLLNDPKENAEHVMLVDLARNDLSKSCKNVEVISYKEIQYFSHVIHLVSKVKGVMKKGVSAFQVFSDTFPAGTLSGAPKFKALSLINKHEPTSRGLYGGGIGLIGLNGDLNHAIIIRSFFSKNNTLNYQAGAGIVISSDEKTELEEVNNKLNALKKSLNLAQHFSL